MVWYGMVWYGMVDVIMKVKLTTTKHQYGGQWPGKVNVEGEKNPLAVFEIDFFLIDSQKKLTDFFWFSVGSHIYF